MNLFPFLVKEKKRSDYLGEFLETVIFNMEGGRFFSSGEFDNVWGRFFCCHLGGVKDTIGTYWTEAREAAKHPTVDRTFLHNKESSGENPCSKTSCLEKGLVVMWSLAVQFGSVHICTIVFGPGRNSVLFRVTCTWGLTFVTYTQEFDLDQPCLVHGRLCTLRFDNLLRRTHRTEQRS